jgi:hypothetical protein
MKTTWKGLAYTGRVDDDGVAIPGNPIRIVCHGHHDQPGLCPVCAADLLLILADTPAILDDLDIAISGDAKFVEHGSIIGQDNDLSSGENSAIAAHQRITVALVGDGTNLHPGVADWFNRCPVERLADGLAAHIDRLAADPRMPRVADDLSSAVARAHKVIDRPADLMDYGPCPECGRPIRQERIHKHDDETLIVCRYPECDYEATMPDHFRRQLDSAEDRWMTLGQIVEAITIGGEVVTRKQIEGWVRHRGLPREQRNVPKWENGQLVEGSMVWVYRLGDVRDMAMKAEIRRGVVGAA